MIAGDILSERARLSPQCEALVTVADGRRYSYAELNARATHLAAILFAQFGIQPGDRVGILSENSAPYIDAYCAAGRSGFILVPLNIRCTAAELAQVTRDCGMKMLLFSERYTNLAAELVQLSGINISARLDEIGKNSATNQITFQRPAPEDIYLLLYTSGTTGKPKGVMLPHRMIAWNAYNTAASWQLLPSDVTSICTPLYHAGGTGVSLPAIFLLGGKIILHDGFHASEVLTAIERERCTFFFAVPTIFEMLTQVPEWQTADLTSLRWCISGGAPLPAPLAEKYRNRGLVMKQGYGLTEAGVNCFAMSADEAARKSGSIGKPMLFCEAKVVPAPGVHDENIGELWLRGPHVALGYWNQPEATAAAFDTNGWLHTGDLARIDDEGFFWIAGRMKEMLISGGVNIYPAEIEHALLDHPAVELAAVIGISDPQWGEVPVAFITTRAPLTLDELTAFLCVRLARYKIPKRIEFLAEMPRTSSGKIAKSELKTKLIPA